MFLSKRNGIYYVFYNNSRGKRTCISTKSKFKSDAIKFLVRFKDELKKRELNNVIPISLQYFINNFQALRDHYGCVDLTLTIGKHIFAFITQRFHRGHR